MPSSAWTSGRSGLPSPTSPISFTIPRLLCSTLFPYTTLFRSATSISACGAAARTPSPGGPTPSAGSSAAGSRTCPTSCRSTRPRSTPTRDRKSTRLNSSHVENSYAVFCLDKRPFRVALAYESDFIHDTSTPVLYPLSLHDALPICHIHLSLWRGGKNAFAGRSDAFRWFLGGWIAHVPDVMPFYAPTVNSYKRSEEHTSELQSRRELVCRLLLGQAAVQGCPRLRVRFHSRYLDSCALPSFPTRRSSDLPHPSQPVARRQERLRRAVRRLPLVPRRLDRARARRHAVLRAHGQLLQEIGRAHV